MESRPDLTELRKLFAKNREDESRSLDSPQLPRPTDSDDQYSQRPPIEGPIRLPELYVGIPPDVGLNTPPAMFNCSSPVNDNVLGHFSRSKLNRF